PLNIFFVYKVSKKFSRAVSLMNCCSCFFSFFSRVHAMEKRSSKAAVPKKKYSLLYIGFNFIPVWCYQSQPWKTIGVNDSVFYFMPRKGLVFNSEISAQVNPVGHGSQLGSRGNSTGGFGHAPQHNFQACFSGRRCHPVRLPEPGGFHQFN